MKLPKIFGVVVLIHVLVITIVLVQPGCRSKPDVAGTTSPSVTTSGTDTYAVDPVLADDFNPVGAPMASSPAPVAASPAPSGARQPPTRPTVRMEPGPGTAAPVPGIEGSPEVRTHVVARGDSPWKISQQYGITLDELLEANNLTRTSTIQPGQTLVIPQSRRAASATTPAPATAAPAVSSAPATTTYTVRTGDTLSAIAARHGTTVAALRQANQITNDIIRAGQVLVIPSAGGGAPAPVARAAGPVEPTGATHTVTPGETAGAIARRYGVSLDALLRANNISDPRRLQIGQVLVIPASASAPAPAPRSTPVASSPAPATPAPAPAAQPTTRPMTPEELEARLRSAEDAELLPVDDAPLAPAGGR